MKYALIGCGRIATNHIKAVLNNGLELVAVCDVIPEHMESLLSKHELQNDTSIKSYTDYKKLIEENKALQSKVDDLTAENSRLTQNVSELARQQHM